MNDKILLYVGDGWGRVLDHAALGIDCRDRLPTPKAKPVYRTFAIRRPGPIDEKAAAAVLDWLRGSLSP